MLFKKVSLCVLKKYSSVGVTVCVSVVVVRGLGCGLTIWGFTVTAVLFGILYEVLL